MKTIIPVIIAFSVLFGNGLYNYDSRFIPAGNSFAVDLLFQDKIELPDSLVKQVEPQPIQYPARPMLYSLVLPGAGQYYNKSPLWKSALFAGMELAGLAAWWSWKSKAEDIRLEYEQFGTDHWSLSDWYTNTQLIFPDNYSSMFSGTHKIMLIAGDEYFSSEFLDSLWGVYGDWSQIDFIRDRDFFENIGKYDQFVGGWDDCYDGSTQLWYEEEKDVGDSTEVIKLTPNKDHYRDLRFDSNTLLDYSKYAISAVMFNHVFSALEAVWWSQRISARKNEEDIETDVGLLYNRHSNMGVGGIYFSVRW